MKRLLPVFAVFALLLLPLSGFATASTRHHHARKAQVHETAHARHHMARLARSRREVAASHPRSSRHAVHQASVTTTTHLVRRHGRLVRVSVHHYSRHRYVEQFTADSFTNSNVGADDIATGENPVVRQAALDALGNMYGTVVVINPDNGRILAMVNQKLALSGGAEPCSTIKISVALAALSEGIVNNDTKVSLGRNYSVDMNYALARSVNAYFETLGRRMGFEKVRHYANEFGLGELAGYDIPGEHLGIYPSQPLPDSKGGVGRMCSFGEGVSMTPLQLGALVSAVANGGTLYYLQHPTTPMEIANFHPRIKRTLDIKPFIPEVAQGMAGAVDASYGTARSLRASFDQFPVMGKTGTCSNDGTRYGWFASFANTPQYGRIVTVIFLEGGRATFGPKAAQLTGILYKDLWDQNFFADRGSNGAGGSTMASNSPSK
jgi:penicillin-binding protein 2